MENRGGLEARKWKNDEIILQSQSMKEISRKIKHSHTILSKDILICCLKAEGWD